MDWKVGSELNKRVERAKSLRLAGWAVMSNEGNVEMCRCAGHVYDSGAATCAACARRNEARCEKQQLNERECKQNGLSTLSVVSGSLSLHGTKVVEQRRIVILN